MTSALPTRLVRSIGLLSSALIAYQVGLIQLLSLTQWFHFAGMVISVALLGFGAAGTVLSLVQDRLLRHHIRAIPVLMALSGGMMSAATSLSRMEGIRFDSYLLFVDRSQWWYLLVLYLLFFIPFFLGALALGISFVLHSGKIGKLYFSNMVGSGVGGLIIAGLSWVLLPGQLSDASAILALLAALLLVSADNRGLVIPLVVALLAYCGYGLLTPAEFALSQYKSISYARDLPGSRVILRQPSPYGLVEVVSAEGLRYSPGISLAFSGEIPVTDVLFNNGEWIGPISGLDAGGETHLLDLTTAGVAYAVSSPGSVLILHGGAGSLASQALMHGATRVDNLEPNRAIANLLLNELSVKNDSLFHNQYLTLIPVQPRAFAASVEQDKRYDLIEFPVIGEFGGSAGKYAMREEYTLTTESFREFINILHSDGIICVTVWMDYPFKNPLKVAATISEVADQLSIQKRSCIAAVRSWSTVTFLVRRSPFDEAEIGRIRAFCDSLYFDPLLLPDLSAEERMTHNVMGDTAFFALIDELMYGDRARLYRDYDFHLRPAEDDKPYFSQFVRWKSLQHLIASADSRTIPFFEMGFALSVVTLGQVSILAMLLIILPLLLRRRWASGGRAWVLLYFSGIGFGYMLIEVALIQRFILVFGNPVYASAALIGAMLIGSGIGSYSTSYLPATDRFLRVVLLVVVILLLLCFGTLTAWLPSLARLPAGPKVLLSVLTIGIPAFFMGMPFPLGIRRLGEQDKNTVAWAWGINGCCSVISAALAYVLAAQIGFMMVMLSAAACYAISFLGCYGKGLKMQG